MKRTILKHARWVALMIGVAIVSALGTAQNNSRNSQCSLAVVTKVAGPEHNICDPATVRALAAHGRVFEANQMGIASILAVAPDYTPAEAAKWFQKAAAKGYAPAQVNLGVMYAHGWGVSQDLGAALNWFHRAADQGYARAYYNLGILYFNGQGVTQDYGQAMKFFRKGADAGDTSAMTNLAYMYDQGLGTKKDLQAAVALYRTAAEKGNAMGENDLADLYLRGIGVPQNDAEAFRLFEQAANQGHSGARIKLAYLYANGRATTKDLETACTLLAAASLAGDSRGQDLLRAVESQLSAEQIAKAKIRAHNLVSSPTATVAAASFAP